MKKLFGILVLGLLWCNVSMADEKVFGGESAELIYSCYSKDLKQKNIIFGFNHINKLWGDFEASWVTHHYDYQNKRFGAAINGVMVANFSEPLWLLSWNDIKEDGFHTYLLRFKGEPDKYLSVLKSNLNNNVEIESYFISNEQNDEDEKILKSEIFDLRKKLFNEKNFDKFKEIYYLHGDKMKILHDKSMSDEFVAIYYKCKRLNKL